MNFFSMYGDNKAMYVQFVDAEEEKVVVETRVAAGAMLVRRFSDISIPSWFYQLISALVAHLVVVLLALED
jgi:hypothetical protein